MAERQFPSHPRECRIFRPYPDECPPELFGYDELSEDDLNWVRVAKWEGQFAGAYHLVPLSATLYEVKAIVVVPRFRGRGLGRWLLAHALGVIESKGGRIVVSRIVRQARFFAKLGFEKKQQKLRLELIPE